jgi:zinc/manganese transport system substrate-binding protein
MIVRRFAVPVALAVIACLAAAGCSPAAVVSAAPGKILAIGAENSYANVISQIGGKYVQVTAVLSNPSTDPHTFETSPSVAAQISAAKLVVQNGLGYDSFMDKIESAAPGRGRMIIDVQHMLGLPDSTPNPHLWYWPRTMPAVARAVAADLTKLQPDHAAYFRANATRFEASLQPWLTALAQFKKTYGRTPVAVTEPVGNYLLAAAGVRILTPFGLQADAMNGVDPAPQDISFQQDLLAGHRVKALLYNQQVTDSLSATFLATARQSGIPVVGLYETMPNPGYSYQSWMLAETDALRKAVADKTSTERL